MPDFRHNRAPRTQSAHPVDMTPRPQTRQSARFPPPPPTRLRMILCDHEIRTGPQDRAGVVLRAALAGTAAASAGAAVRLGVRPFSGSSARRERGGVSPAALRDRPAITK